MVSLASPSAMSYQLAQEHCPMSAKKPVTAAMALKSKRTSEDQYYLNIAHEVAGRATCLRRKFGAVIVKSKQIVSTGYNGAPRGTANCSDLNSCLRNDLGAKPGEHYEWCRSVHGEANAIIHASRFDMIGAELYLVGIDAVTGQIAAEAEPCRMCKRLIINAGIEKVIVQAGAGKIRYFRVSDWTKTNLGEYELVKGRLIAVRPSGY
jgi:dCMP deaminase